MMGSDNNGTYIIYNLTKRGLFSEILNLALAKSYADFVGKEIVINTRNWNAKIHNGWSDYFLETLPCINDFCTSQMYLAGRRKKIELRDWYHYPKRTILHCVLCVVNQVFQRINGSFILNDEIYDKMKSDTFVHSMSDSELFANYKQIVQQLFVYNDDIRKRIQDLKKRMKLPEQYIGVHIRRGDKISTHEMNDISIDMYVEEIFKNANVCKNVFVATDDSSIIKYIKEKMTPSGFIVYYNSFITQDGFNEKNYNRKCKSDRFENTLYTLLDVDILINSAFFIGTYSSNLSRIIPCFLDEGRCKSLDLNWNIMF